MNRFYTSLLLVLVMCIGFSNAYSQCTNLFFSEYIEGSSNNKAVEIFNPTENAIDLSGYSVSAYNNGGTEVTNQLTWPVGTMLAAGDVYVIANSQADSATILSVSDTTSNITFYNGDDALVLRDTVAGVDIDIIGVVGEDPGSEWPVGSGSTKEHTIVRKSSVNDGETNWALAVLGWTSFDQNFTDSLGFHNINSCEATSNPIASFDISGESVAENAGGVEVHITLSEIDDDYTITLEVLGASTADGADYTIIGGTSIPIQEGDTAIWFQIDIEDDDTPEDNETVIIQISEGGGNVTFGNDTYTLTILDDDNPPTPPCEYPFFSEYIEGSSSNKALEIFNPTEAPIDLGDFQINRFNNGNDGSEDTSGIFNWPLSTMIGSMEVYIIANPDADSLILILADTTSSITFYNGDDVLDLEHIASNMSLDRIGNLGEDPGSGWPVDDEATNNSTLVRHPSVNGGQTNWFLGEMTWIGYDIDFIDSLGSHYMEPCMAPGPCDTTNINIEGIVTDESIDGTNDGAIDISVSGGDGNYTYDWSNDETTQDIDNLEPGNYTVIVEDGNGCLGDAAFVVEPGPGPCDTTNIEITGVVTDESFDGANDGAIDITVTGGDGNYTYDWSNDETTQDIDNLEPGNYTVIVEDGNGCLDDASFTVEAGPDPCQGVDISILVEPTSESAPGAEDGAIDITVTGGTPPYTYLWSNSETTEDIDGLSGGNYEVLVEDSNGCLEDANVILGTGTGLNEIAGLKIFSVYPNPAMDAFQVELQFDRIHEVQLQIVDVHGRTVLELTPENTRSRIYTINADWPSGIYFLNIRAEGDLAVEPVIITK